MLKALLWLLFPLGSFTTQSPFYDLQKFHDAPCHPSPHSTPHPLSNFLSYHSLLCLLSCSHFGFLLKYQKGKQPFPSSGPLHFYPLGQKHFTPVLCGLSACMLSHVQLFATLWTAVHQAPLSMGFSRQEYWNGLPCPAPI